MSAEVVVKFEALFEELGRQKERAAALEKRLKHLEEVVDFIRRDLHIPDFRVISEGRD